VLVACGTGRRRAGPHALLSLRHRAAESIAGRPSSLRAQLDDLEQVRRQLVAALARATGRPAAELDDELDNGPLLDPQQATAAGLLDP
jgi:ATP-dependent protease ClpP protease subunit